MKAQKLSLLLLLFLLLANSISALSVSADTVIEINQNVDGNANYKKAEFSGEQTDLNHYFKYSVSTIPTSRVTAFRFEFDTFYTFSTKTTKVLCTFVDSSTSDADLIEALRAIDDTTTSCVGAFNENGIYDGIIEFDETKTKMGIYLVTLGGYQFNARIYLKITETFLSAEEQKANEDESYSLIPYSIVIADFREKASKILFYSYTRDMQMYYVELETPYPERLFYGNIMSVYTNPNMVRQKYHNATTMVLLTKPFGATDIFGEVFKFQVKFLDTNFLLDYFVSANSEGRSTNSPLSINMTNCYSPYYVIVNYNQPEAQRSLYVDLIYGKLKSISVATKFTQDTWEEMIETDMSEVDVKLRKYVLPKNQDDHMDVYKIQCEIPLLVNFYYVDETATIPQLEHGKVVLTTLKSYKSLSLTFKEGIFAPQLTIEIFNPNEAPLAIVDVGINENVVSENTVIKMTPLSTQDGIIIKERKGSSDTRVIVKVGYDTYSWTVVSDNIQYNQNLNLYVYTFPYDEKRLNYTYITISVSGTNEDDNVKFCYGTNLGTAVLPSQENCFRVSSENSYPLKIVNPYIMYKDYEVSDELNYYLTMKPVSDTDKLNFFIMSTLYNTKERNYEGVNNMVTISSLGEYSTILTAPKDKNPSIFVQIQSCDNTQAVKIDIINAYNTTETIVPEEEIPAGRKNYYKVYTNIFLESELELAATSGTNIFVKHVGIDGAYTPSIKNYFSVVFNPNLNELEITNPTNDQQKMKYTVYVTEKGGLSSKSITLCTFTDPNEYGNLAKYNKTVTSSNEITSVQINFVKVGLSAGTAFEAIVFAEQQENGQMDFLSTVVSGTVGEITTESIFEITEEYSTDTDYAYIYHESEPNEMTYYFTYLAARTLDYPVGAFSVELDADVVGSFSNVACAFVNEDDDAMTMVETIENVIEEGKSYCIGGRSTTNDRKYNYIFKYEKNGTSKYKKLIIKISNGQYADGGFTVYVRKGENTYLEKTDFTTQQEYGRQEEYKKSVMPYIVDLEKIRGSEDDENKISKILIYSQHLEMQMYYLDDDEYAPVELFTGNIMLVLTKLTLAIQKYHATTLVLLSENLEGQEHSSLGNTFRFHTKMFKSDDQIEYFVSNNPEGRTINYPLSVEMNTCTSTNNKYYYILNYNKQEDDRILYLDMLFGSAKKVRIANEINAERWDSLIENSMTEITNYQIELASKTQHIDVVEFECNTPLLANVYYNYEGIVYSNLQKGDIVVKNLGANENIYMSLEPSTTGSLFYSVSAFNPVANPDVTIRFSNNIIHQVKENGLIYGILFSIPEAILIVNNGNTTTRLIFKLGLGVESEWNDEGLTDIKGKLYSLGNNYVYKFPYGDSKRNYTNVKINVKPIRDESGEEQENVKFCYSTSIGMAIDASKENCFRTGANIPYELTFVNPLIAPKNYKSTSDNYYISLFPYDDDDFISLEITENTYDTLNRNFEGQHKVINLQDGLESTILSIPSISTNKIFVELKACVAGMGTIPYINYNAYSLEQLSTGEIKYSDTLNYYTIENNLMETQILFNGSINDTVFVKHVGLDPNYKLTIQSNYSAEFDEDQNTVYIVKPVYNEEFNVTVLVGKKGKFADYTLCTFAELSQDKYSQLADYVKTFSSVSSNKITHFIDFRSFNYAEGDEFDLLVYAVQSENTKLEFLFPVISGVVGKIKGVVEITDYVTDKPDYVTVTFIQNTTSNYLFYDFKRSPTGDVAALKIEETGTGLRVNKVGCTFVKTKSEDSEMVAAVNKAMLEGTSVCIGETQKDGDGFDALINAVDVKNSYTRLVVQVLYGLGDENEYNKLKENGKLNEEISITVNMRINGYSVSDADVSYNEEEKLTAMPYVFDLLTIRQKIIGDNDYVSKILLYSNTREMQMFYLGSSGSPVELFSGNIMMVYTNEELVKQKYQGATTMILLTDSLSSTSRKILGEQFRFKVSFFNSAKTIQYYVSANPSGRLLNNPTSIEMLSCDQPYYYILNYNFVEGERILHVDTIFGEVQTTKIATALNQDNWYDLVNEMQNFTGNQVVLEEQTKYHMDVVEVTCKIPVLLNLYYTDPLNPKVSNLDEGDISIISLLPGKTDTFYLKSGLDGEFIYSFNVMKTTTPNVLVQFSDNTKIEIKQNGVFTKTSTERYNYITVKNLETAGSYETKVIFKFGYSIEKTFTKIRNDMYNLQTDDREVNLFAYKFKTTDDRLNYTKVNFTVSTTEENVKFCYITNLGAFIDPSQTNCFRVGRSNPYTISVLNPYVMYKNYYTGDTVMDYYVGFRTIELSQNITILPTLIKYSTDNRNEESVGQSVSLTREGTYTTILTAPKNGENYVFVHIQICGKDQSMNYEFLNAYNESSLGASGEIQANTKNNFRSIENTKLDTELKLEGNSRVKLYIKHVGLQERYQPALKELEPTYSDKKLSFIQPIENEEFKYTILVDKKDELKNKEITLCDVSEASKLAHYTKTITSKSSNPSVELDFSSSALKGYENFDILVVAEQINNGKLVFLSDILSSYSTAGSNGSNVGFIVIIVILCVVLVVGGALAIIFLRKYKGDGSMKNVIDAKATSLADLNASPNEKLIASQAVA